MVFETQKTLEVLETKSVPVYGWKTHEFPAFFSPKSGVPCPFHADNETEIADAYRFCRALELKQGMLVAVPNDDAAGDNVENAIKEALVEADKRGIKGQDTTPFILKYVADKTSGDSLRSNIALVKKNAEVGAKIAIAITKQSSSSYTL